MKQTLFLFSIISFFFLIINCSNNENEDTIHIFQVNSLRGLIFPTGEKVNNKSTLYGGISLISQAIVNIESTSGDKPIIIGNGNMYFGTPVSHFSQGKAVINVMNELHFDCLIIGHREFYI